MSPSSSQRPPPLGTCAPARMHTMTGARVQALLFKLDRIWEALVEAHVLPLHLEDQQPQQQQCDDNKNDWYTPGEVAGGGKHVCQEASILYHLQRMGALDKSNTTSSNNDTTNGSKNCPQDNDNHNHHYHHPMEYVAVELGAGTGRLSDRLSRFVSLQQPQTSMQHVLVDRRTDLAPAQCRDRVIRARQQQQQQQQHPRRDMGSAVQRVVLDIAHLDLAKYYAVASTANPSINSTSCTAPRHVCMSKHLCGPACDLALDSLARYKKQQQQQQQQQQQPVYCALATCCHYLCSWQSFAAGGQSFWMALGLTQDDFQVAVAASQWASLNKTTKSHEKHTNNHGASTHGSRDAATTSKRYQEDGLDNLLEVAQRIGPTSAGSIANSDTNNDPLLQLSSDEFERAFSRTQKATLGWKIKQLLDLARACHLQQMGYSRVKLVRYTSRSIDDRLLLAW